MNERIARLQALQNNIARYEGLLKSKLSAVELRFVERRLSEKRFDVQRLSDGKRVAGMSVVGTLSRHCAMADLSPLSKSGHRLC